MVDNIYPNRQLPCSDNPIPCLDVVKPLSSSLVNPASTRLIGLMNNARDYIKEGWVNKFTSVVLTLFSEI